VIRTRRAPQLILVFVGAWGPFPCGITLWRDGAISLQVRNHWLQVVFGDWWQATRRHATSTTPGGQSATADIHLRMAEDALSRYDKVSYATRR